MTQRYNQVSFVSCLIGMLYTVSAWAADVTSNNKCLQVVGEHVDLVDCDGRIEQRWILACIGDTYEDYHALGCSYYEIISEHNGKCLTIVGGYITTDVDVVLSTCGLDIPMWSSVDTSIVDGYGFDSIDNLVDMSSLVVAQDGRVVASSPVVAEDELAHSLGDIVADEDGFGVGVGSIRVAGDSAYSVVALMQLLQDLQRGHIQGWLIRDLRFQGVVYANLQQYAH